MLGMPAAERTVVIAAPITTVFAFFTDHANDPKWRPGVMDIEPNPAPGVGVVITQGVAGPMGRRIPADFEITDYDPPRAYGFRAIAGPVQPVGSYTLTEAGAGTSVTFRLSAELGRLKQMAMGSMVQRTMDAEVAALDKAKAVLESA